MPRRPDAAMFNVISSPVVAIMALELRLLARGFQKTVGDLMPRQYRFWISSALEGGSLLPGEEATLYWREESEPAGAEEPGSEVGTKPL